MAALSVTGPAAGRAAVPIVVDSPHSGRDYPADFGSVLPIEVLRLGEDLFIDQLWARAPEHGATLICANFPRVYLDPNRDPADLDPELLAEPWPGELRPGPKSRRGVGLVWRRALDGQAIYDRRLTVAEVQRRIERCHAPYHAAVEQAIEDAFARHRRVLHLNVHSMPDDAYALQGLPEKPLADFVLGDLDGRTCGEPLVACAEAVLRRHGYTVARNDPFKGVELIARHGRPAEGRHALQVELKRSCYADVAAHRPHAGFGRVQAALDDLLSTLATELAGRADA